MGDVTPFLPKENPEEPVALHIASPSHTLMSIDGGFRVFTIYGEDGGILVRINMKTGEAQLVGDANEAARIFWRAVGVMCPLKG